MRREVRNFYLLWGINRGEKNATQSTMYFSNTRCCIAQKREDNTVYVNNSEAKYIL